MLTLILASLLANASGPGNSNNYLYNINHNQRSDTVDVLHFHVNLNITSVTSSPISGYTDVTFTPKINGIAHLSLDLLKMNVDYYYGTEAQQKTVEFKHSKVHF